MATKKKYTQHDLRRMMNEQKTKQLQATKETDKPKISSPLAKYNELGQLTCVLCKSVVRSESVWAVHINAKQHKQNVLMAKELKERATTMSKQGTLKRSATTLLESTTPAKMLKSILRKPEGQSQQVTTSNASNGIPVATSTSLPSNSSKPSTSKVSSEKMEETDEKLPEGFFDDPHLDAKARNIEYKDPNEEEWERFQKEIKSVTNISTNIINEEQETATAERQIIEIDEQIRNWSRVLNLEKRKETIISETKTKAEKMEIDISEDEEEEQDQEIDEFLDWRAKKSHK